MSTYQPIASITLASDTSEITFTGIPQTYTDLVLVANVRYSGTSGAQELRCRLNSDTGSNYSVTVLQGTGSAASSSRRTSATSLYFTFGRSDQNAGGFATNIAHFMNYSNTTTNKTILCRNGEAGGGTAADVNLWRSTSAITSITFLNDITYKSGSTFNLYGIANASITNVAKATGGDSVYTDGTYWYHIFRSSGTFTPTQALTADYLVVAGGGGGTNTSNNAAGGGGGGGLRCTVGATGGGGSLESALSLTAQAYTVTVGAGGANGVGATAGSNGSNSVFSTITSTGGGGSPASSSTAGVPANGVTGGSGSGGNGGGTGGAGTANQGYAGGGSVTTGGGGGGGAGGVGGTGTTNTGGNGGAGVTSSISGSSASYAGGGGANAYGGTPVAGTATAGGGAGTLTGTGNSGTANTGGGGGSTNSGTGGAGGSGIVVIRYSI